MFLVEKMLCSNFYDEFYFLISKRISGLWAREFGRLNNLDIPLAIVEHQYACIGPLPEVKQIFFFCGIFFKMNDFFWN